MSVRLYGPFVGSFVGMDHSFRRIKKEFIKVIQNRTLKPAYITIS